MEVEDELIAAAAESTVNYRVPETRTKVMPDGTVMEVETAVFPKRNVEAAPQAAETKAVDDAGESQAPSTENALVDVSLDSQNDNQSETDGVSSVNTDPVVAETKEELSPEEYAESKATKPPTQLPSDLPYDDTHEVTVSESGETLPAIDEVAAAELPAVSVLRTDSAPTDVVTPSAEVAVEDVVKTERLSDDSDRINVFKKVLMGLSVLTMVHSVDPSLTREQYIASVENMSASRLLMHMQRAHDAISHRWLRRIMDVIDYLSLMHFIKSIPNRPPNSDTFYLSRMTCYGPRISPMFVLYGSQVTLTSEEAENDAQAFDQWIDCLKHEENLLITIEAMFTYEDLYRGALRRVQQEDP